MRIVVNRNMKRRKIHMSYNFNNCAKINNLNNVLADHAYIVVAIILDH